MVGIYKITNNLNGKSYIGQSVNIEKRIRTHFWEANKEYRLGYNNALSGAIRKYGKENFSYEILEQCSIIDLDEKEIFYIEKENTLSPNGYNLTRGGSAFHGNKFYNYKTNNCKKCGKPIEAVSYFCRECYKQNLASNIPTQDVLIKTIYKEKGNFRQVGKVFNVSDNTVRKWCKRYNLPHSSLSWRKIIKDEVAE